MPVTLTAFGAPPAPATAKVVSQGPADRLMRVATGLGLFWGIALVTLFIPVAHFILVPTFTVAGIAVAIARAREDVRLVGVHGACPRCGREQDFKVGGRLAATRSFDCPACHQNLTLVANGAPTGA